MQIGPVSQKFFVSVVSFGGNFEVEKGIQEAFVLDEALWFTPFGLLKTQLVAHDVGHLKNRQLGNADIAANPFQVILNGLAGGIVRRKAAIDQFLCKELVVFSEEQGKEQGGVDA